MLTSCTLSHFSIGRPNPNGNPIKNVGPKSILVAYSNNLLISDVEEYGSIGFGIGVGYCTGVEVKNCYVHDHENGSNHLSGTDGMDIWYSTNIYIHDNTVQRVGDDGISIIGTNAYPDSNVVCKNNNLTATNGSIKFYGTVSNVDASYNTGFDCTNGLATLWIDNIDYNEVGTISGINIHDNIANSCGGSGATGGITLTTVSGSIPQTITGITINNNTIKNSPTGVTIFSATTTQLYSNITVTNNLAVGCTIGILAGALQNNFVLSGNYIQNCTGGGIDIAMTDSNESTGMGTGTFLIENNIITNFESIAIRYFNTMGGIIILSGTPGNYTISGNTITDPQVNYPVYYAINSAIGLSTATLSQSNPGIDMSTTLGVYSIAP
jgi:hypothetical protein